MNEIIKRKTVQNLCDAKRNILQLIHNLYETHKEIDLEFEELNRYSPIYLDKRFNNFDKNREEKYVDMVCWQYLVDLFELQKYMICTEYEKMCAQIESFAFPVFNLENANGYVASMKDTIYENITTMLKSVYDKIINSHYYTGSGYSS